MGEYTGKDFVSANEGTQTINGLGCRAACECSDAMGAHGKVALSDPAQDCG